MARFAKDLRHLCRQIGSISGSQARIYHDKTSLSPRIAHHCSNILETEESLNASSFFLEISPRDGPYANASFLFHIESNSENEYPDFQPIVSCLTPIYHPNIDTTYGNFHNNVCVSTLNDWDGGPMSTFEDLLQGLLFLFHSPNLSDPLTSNVSSDEEEFFANIRISIEGGLIEDFSEVPFEINYGYKRYLFEQAKQYVHDGEKLDDHLVEALTREPNFKQIFTPDTLEFLMDTPASSCVHAIRHNKETVSYT
jgi:ubiquitin-protein ligase